MHRKFTLVVRGDTDDDFDDALDAASILIRQGNLSGTAREAHGAFYFDSTTDVPESDLPH